MSTAEKSDILTSGRDFKAFWADTETFAEGTIVDDFSLVVNGILMSSDDPDFDVENLLDEDVVQSNSGVVVEEDGDPRPVEEVFNAWLQKRTHVSLVVRVKKSDEAAVRAAIQALGATVG